MPGPPPEHPRLRLLKGNAGKRPARSPPVPARTEECPPPPSHLNAYAKEEWQRIAPELHRLNLLTVLDIGPLAAYCSAAARLRQAEEAMEEMVKQDQRGNALTIEGSAGNQVTNPLLRIASQAMADMQRIGAQFGLTPNGRLRLSGIQTPPPPSKFDGSPMSRVAHADRQCSALRIRLQRLVQWPRAAAAPAPVAFGGH